MAAAAGTGVTVLIASHVVSELERLCDWLIVLTGGHVQLAGPADDLIAAHQLLTVPRATADAELPGLIIHRTDSDRHSAVLVRADPVRICTPPATLPLLRTPPATSRGRNWPRARPRHSPAIPATSRTKKSPT